MAKKTSYALKQLIPEENPKTEQNILLENQQRV